MRKRILTIALALSLVVVAFAALPGRTTANVDYTGNVRTTNDLNETKTIFVEGESIYYTIELYCIGDPADENVHISVTDGTSMDVSTVAGWYVSSPVFLTVSTFDSPDVKVCDVVATVGGYEFARTQITVLNERLTLDPDLATYYPGQSVAISLVTVHTEDFYVEIVNDTGEDLANWTSQETGDDRYWNTVWNIPADFPDGDYTVNVVREDNHVVWWQFTHHFGVFKYDLDVFVYRDCVLPKETVSISYMITSVATGLPYESPAIVIEYQAQYFNTLVEPIVDDNETNVSGTLPGCSGTFNYTIPSDIALWSNVWFEFWANESDSDRSSWVDLELMLSLLDAAVSTDKSSYYPSESVGVTVTAYAEEDTTYDLLDGATASVKVSLNGTEILIYGAVGLVTGKNGQVTYMFTLLQNAPAGVYIVEATVAKLDMTKVVMRAFSVVESASMTVDFDSEVYIGGDVATVSFRPLLNNMDYVGADISYVIYTDGGILASGNSSGEDASVVIPVDYYGDLDVEAGAYINGNPVDDDDDAEVVIAELMLVVAEELYRPGETIVWNWEIRTGLMNASLTYWIKDHDGVLMATDAPAFALTGAIEFDVPADDVSSHYTATLRMMSALGGVTDKSVTASVYDDYEVQIWVKKSKYASGEFKPGDTMTIGYEIIPLSGDSLPTYKLRFSFSGDNAYYYILVTETEGTFEYEIPKDYSVGAKTVSCYLYEGGGTSSLSYDSAYYVVNNRLGFWDLSAGGMAASDFLLMVLLVVLIIVLIVMPLVKGWQAKAKSSSPAPEEPPPAEPPKA